LARPQQATIYKDQATVCRRLGIAPRTLQRDMKDPGFPDCSAGYDLEAIREFRLRRNRPATEARDEARELDLETKRHRKEQERLKAERMRHQLEEFEGNLLPRPVVELAIASILTHLGDWCDQFPEFIRNFCCRSCRDRVESALKKELDKGRADACQRLSAIEGTDASFADLIEALLDSDCAKVAAALCHVMDPGKLARGIPPARFERTPTDDGSQEETTRLEPDERAAPRAGAGTRTARRSENRKPRPPGNSEEGRLETDS